jgi:hypothetical protein
MYIEAIKRSTAQRQVANIAVLATLVMVIHIDEVCALSACC